VTNVNLFHGENLQSQTQLSICNTCVFSYIFSDDHDTFDVLPIIFRETAEPIPVFFDYQTLAFANTEGELMEFNLTIGIIPTKYQTLEFFT
jgi:hypothetical protein